MVLDQFSRISRLHINARKSIMVLGGTRVDPDPIVSALGINVGHLPLTYLGLPLVSKRLSRDQCLPLLSRLQAKLAGWKGRFLAMAGRCSLIQSVLTSSVRYWMDVFKLPDLVLGEIDSLLAGFLWKEGRAQGFLGSPVAYHRRKEALGCEGPWRVIHWAW